MSKPTLTGKEINYLIDFSTKIVKESELITLKYYNRKIIPSYKKNKSPVTIADFKCEDYLINRIMKNYPHHAVYSEERGSNKAESEYKWIIDPVDGTRNFMRNFPFWGTLLALEFSGEVILGIISMPALSEIMVAAKGRGCYVNGKKVQVSKINKIENSYFLFGGLDYIHKSKYKKRFFDLVHTCPYNRGFGDCHGHTFIIKGKAEIMFDPKTAPYDIAATKICLEEAGGKLTDIKGNDTIYGGNALITNGKLHDIVLKYFNG